MGSGKDQCQEEDKSLERVFLPPHSRHSPTHPFLYTPFILLYRQNHLLTALSSCCHFYQAYKEILETRFFSALFNVTIFKKPPLPDFFPSFYIRSFSLSVFEPDIISSSSHYMNCYISFLSSKLRKIIKSVFTKSVEIMLLRLET